MREPSATPSRRRRAPLVAAGVVVTALAAAVYALRASQKPAPGRAMPAATAAADCGRTVPVPGADGRERIRYRLSYRTELCGAGECTTLLELTGDLVAGERAARQGVDHVVDLQLSPETVKGDVQAKLPNRAALGTPLTVRYTPQGRVAELRTADQVDAPTRRLLESIVRDLQVANPACSGPDEKHFSAVEELVVANVMSNFSFDPAAHELEWTRDQVLSWNDASDLFPLRARASKLAVSKHSARLTSERHVASLSGLDEYVLQAGGPGEELKLKVSIGLEPSEKPVAAVAAPAGAGFETASAHSELADEQRIGGRDLTGILGELVRADQNKDPDARARLYVAASALFRRDPEAAKQAQAMARNGHRDQKFLLRALGDAGTAQSAKLLAELLADPSLENLRALVLGALGRATVADPGVVDAMTGLFGDSKVGGSARLMTGALASNTRENSPETSERAVGALLDDYHLASSPVQRADGLRSLGNAGDVAALREAREAAQSSDPIVRAAAAQALRRIPSDAADRILAVLVEDPVDFVRGSALGAALYRDPTEILVPVVERVARLDALANIRREAVRVLVRWKDQVPSARATLEWVAQNDPEPDLRKVASEGLARFSN